MRLPTSRTRHRLQFAAAILGTVSAVYGFSRLIHPHRVPITTPPQVIAYVPAPQIIPRDENLVPQVAPLPPRVSPAFMSAVGESDIATMEKLYTKGMPLDGTLATAATTGNKPTVTWLLDHDADIHDGEDDFESPVLAADAHPAIVKLLLDRGAKEATLSTACVAGAPNAVNRLLAKHALVNPKDGGSFITDAMNSSALPEVRQAIVMKLLAAGADPNTGADSTPPIALALSSCEPPEENDNQPSASSTPPTCLGFVKLLMAHGARVTGDSLSSTFDLAEPMRSQVLDVILAGGHLEPGATALALSSANGERDAKIIQKIASKGVAWAWHDGEEDSSAPLVEAVDHVDVSLVRAMLDAGAPADLHMKDGRSPLGLALDKVSTDGDAAARIVEMLILHGAQVNRRLPDGRTPLFAAAEAGEIRVVNALLEHGARVNDLILDETALDAAERSSNISVARILHAHGGRRNVKQE